MAYPGQESESEERVESSDEHSESECPSNSSRICRKPSFSFCSYKHLHHFGAV